MAMDSRGASAAAIIVIFFLVRAHCDQDPNKSQPPQPLQAARSIERLVVISVAERPQGDTFARFNQSAEANSLDLSIISVPTDHQQQHSWRQLKFEALQKALFQHKAEPEVLVLLLLDNDAAIINADAPAIIRRFKSQLSGNPRILFSADSVCWPDESLRAKYPQPLTEAAARNRFLSSRALIGYAPELWQLFGSDQRRQLVADSNYDFQLFATRIYLDSEGREHLGLQLDSRCELFENLRESGNKIDLEFRADGVEMRDLIHGTRPALVYGSNSSRVLLNSLGNYLAGAWTESRGCRHCAAGGGGLSLAALEGAGQWPLVLVGVFIEEPTPFLDEFFVSLLKLSYPVHRIHLIVHNSVQFHAAQVAKFLDSSAHGLDYASRRQLDQQLSETEARERALDLCLELECNFYFVLDSTARIELPDTLRLLVETNRRAVAPLLSRPRKLWSNFWMALAPDGFYKRSFDYIDLVTRKRQGLWNSAHISDAYLLRADLLRAIKRPLYSVAGDQRELKPALAMSANLRAAEVFAWLDNRHHFGHLVDPSSYNSSLLHPDFYQLENNLVEWKDKYLHRDYDSLLRGHANHSNIESPCQDVYWLPLVSERFADELVATMEQFGQWSSGTNTDPRIEGGYESVPTRDIHFKQVGLHEMWLFFLREFVMPIQVQQYDGYEHDPPRTDLAFVVRYHPEEQHSLRPHHDSSTYTLNIALNEPGRDYQGGGCRFVRYNCSVTDSRKGWALIHPGRLTHYHEGLRVTNGTRYILVTFVDP